MLESLVASIFGLLGVLIGAAIAWIASSRQHRLQTTLELHREHNGPEMSFSRGAAAHVIRDNREPFDVLNRKLEPAEKQHLWNVTFFYQRLWLAIHHGHVREDYVSEMFGEIFFWWYVNCFSSQLSPLNWMARDHIESLKAWLDRDNDPTDIARWAKRARTAGLVIGAAGVDPADDSGGD